MSKKLIALITSICILLSVSLPVSAMGNTDNASSEQVHEIMPRNYPDGPYHENELALGRVGQHKANWCWAACCEMVLYWFGIDTTQEKIANAMKPGDSNTHDGTMANSQKVTDFLNLYFKHKFTAENKKAPPTDSEIISNIESWSPMILVTGDYLADTGHDVVCCGYITPYEGSTDVTHLIILNPSGEYPNTMRAAYDEETNVLSMPTGRYDANGNEFMYWIEVSNVITLKDK